MRGFAGPRQSVSTVGDSLTALAAFTDQFYCPVDVDSSRQAKNDHLRQLVTFYRDRDRWSDAPPKGTCPNVQATSRPLTKSSVQSDVTTMTSRPCAVCGNLASGFYFGVLVCLPCKSFYIRCTQRTQPGFRNECDGNCDVTHSTRPPCSRCRFQKCLSQGMCRREKPDVVIPSHEQFLCAVCGDIANGVHFGVASCEGCKKFFRRSLSEHQTFVCNSSRKCTMNPRTRTNCRYCRFQQCLRSGMCRQAIKLGRQKKRKWPRAGPWKGNMARHQILRDGDSDGKEEQQRKQEDPGQHETATAPEQSRVSDDVTTLGLQNSDAEVVTNLELQNNDAEVVTTLGLQNSDAENITTLGLQNSCSEVVTTLGLLNNDTEVSTICPLSDEFLDELCKELPTDLCVDMDVCPSTPGSLTSAVSARSDHSFSVTSSNETWPSLDTIMFEEPEEYTVKEMVNSGESITIALEQNADHTEMGNAMASEWLDVRFKAASDLVELHSECPAVNTASEACEGSGTEIPLSSDQTFTWFDQTCAHSFFAPPFPDTEQRGTTRPKQTPPLVKSSLHHGQTTPVQDQSHELPPTGDVTVRVNNGRRNGYFRVFPCKQNSAYSQFPSLDQAGSQAYQESFNRSERRGKSQQVFVPAQARFASVCRYWGTGGGHK